MKYLSNIQLEDVPRVHNEHVDVLVTLASKIDVPDNVVNVQIIKRIMRFDWLIIMKFTSSGGVLA